MFDSSIKGNLTGKRIRKSAVSRHRQLADCGKSGGLSKDELARQMSHSITTAEGHYAMRDAIKGTLLTYSQQKNDQFFMQNDPLKMF